MSTLPKNVMLMTTGETEREIAEALSGRRLRMEPSAPPAPPLPDYVEHKPDVPRVGRLTAEAVAIDYEAAAKEIEALGKQLTELQARVEKEAQAVHEAIVEVKALATSYRDEGVRLFNRMEECALLTQSVRQVCTELASKIGGSK